MKESAGVVAILVTRSGNCDWPCSVTTATADGTAKAGAKYTAASGQVRFGVRETQKRIDVPIVDTCGRTGRAQLGDHRRARAR